jgi:hypothetical protein
MPAAEDLCNGKKKKKKTTKFMLPPASKRDSLDGTSKRR